MHKLYSTLAMTAVICLFLPETAQGESDFPEWAMGPFVKLDKPVLSPTAESVFDWPVEKRGV